MKSSVNYKLYLIADKSIVKGSSFIELVEQAIIGGVTVVQLREKTASSLEFYQMALQLRLLTSRYGVPLIINDRLDIALAVDADGVHLGQEDLPLKICRKIIGDKKIVGVSATTLKEALTAQDDGADYIGVGALFPTSTKDNAKNVTLKQISLIKKALKIPIIGIGGINESNLEAAIATGIDGAAVASAILTAESVIDAAKRLSWILKE